MLRKRWLVAIFVLVLASLACNLVTGAKSTPASGSSGGGEKIVVTEEVEEQATSVTEAATEELVEPTNTASSGEQPGSQDYNTEFPLPDDVSQFMDMGSGSVNFQTGMNIKDTLAFYRDAFDKAGYTEREINTAITDATFSLVFDGHASGKAIVIQAVDLGGGKTNINIRFEDL